MVSAIVLAAGMSSRMQQNKMLLRLPNGNEMIKEVLQRIRSAKFGEVILVTGNMSDRVEKIVDGLEVKVVFNSQYKSGMTSSIQEGLRAIDSRSEGICVCLGDMPLITTSDYKILLDSFKQAYANDKNVIVAPSFKGKQGHPVFFAKSYFSEIEVCADPEGCKQIVRSNSSHVKQIEMAEAYVLKDFDTPEDMKDLKSSN